MWQNCDNIATKCNKIAIQCDKFEAKCEKFEAKCDKFEAKCDKFEAKCSKMFQIRRNFNFLGLKFWREQQAQQFSPSMDLHFSRSKWYFAGGNLHFAIKSGFVSFDETEIKSPKYPLFLVPWELHCLCMYLCLNGRHSIEDNMIKNQVELLCATHSREAGHKKLNLINRGSRYPDCIIHNLLIGFLKQKKLECLRNEGTNACLLCS